MTRFDKLVKTARDHGIPVEGTQEILFAALADLAVTATQRGLCVPVSDGDRGANGSGKDFSKGAAAHALVTLEHLFTLE